MHKSLPSWKPLRNSKVISEEQWDVENWRKFLSGKKGKTALAKLLFDEGFSTIVIFYSGALKLRKGNFPSIFLLHLQTGKATGKVYWLHLLTSQTVVDLYVPTPSISFPYHCPYILCTLPYLRVLT